MLRSSLLLLLIVAVLSPALGCDWLRGYRDLRNRTVVLIQTMGGPMAVQDPTDYFPYNLYRQVHSRGVQVQLWFIRENLQHIHDLYHRSNCSSAWNQQKRMEFMQSVERQIQELSSCLKEPDVAKERRILAKQLRRFYRKLRRQSLEPSGSVGSHQPGSDPGSNPGSDSGSAGCELLRKVTLTHLNRIDFLRNHAYQRAGSPGPKR
ncbi:interferon omega-2 isoform X1 [Oryzias melastigma]|uniref:Interferon omega-2-like n=1 Tax=Oryzias melastigma TaxID=30732 RepID=A0A3B3D1K0_ORYME|nr:interferon omega-2 isoform X1 [Oryzias melastigma]